MSPQGELRWYAYRAVSAVGDIQRGRAMARTRDQVVRDLAPRGLSVLDVRLDGKPEWMRRRVPLGDLAAVFENIATLTSHGVPVERALAASEPLVKGRLLDALVAVRGLIREGDGVGAAMRAMPGVFPESVIGTIEAGERGSDLSAAAAAAAEQLAYEAELRSDVASALAYPLMVLAAGMGTVAVLLWVVVPRFAVILTDLGDTLPPLTAALLWVSQHAADWAPVALPSAVAAGILLSVRSRQPETRARLHQLLLELPVVGPLRMELAAARVCRALGAVLRAGGTILSAIDAASDGAGDLAIAARLARVRQRVAEGSTLRDACEAEGALSPLALQLVGIGEAGGSLADALMRAADASAGRARRRLKDGVRLIEPLLIVGLGGVVALVAAALLSAVYSVRPVG